LHEKKCIEFYVDLIEPVALNDSINPKGGRKIFGCGHF